MRRGDVGTDGAGEQGVRARSCFLLLLLPLLFLAGRQDFKCATNATQRARRDQTSSARFTFHPKGFFGCKHLDLTSGRVVAPQKT